MFAVRDVRELRRGDREGLLLALVAVVRAELLLERPLQVAGGLELLDDVGAADQLAADEDLRDRRPARLRRKLLADRRIGKDVDGGDRRARPAERLERPHRVAAHGHLRRALHEQGDVLALDHLPDVRAQVSHARPFRLDPQLVDGAVGERRRQRLVDEPVLVDQREPGEPRARNGHLEVVAGAGAVLDVELGRVGKRVGQQRADRARSPRGHASHRRSLYVTMLSTERKARR